MAVTQSSPAAGARRPGPDRLFEAAALSIDRMPMLRVVFDKMTNLCTDSLQLMSGSQARYSVDELKVVRVGDVVDACDENIIPGVLKASGWDALLLVCLDRAFVYTLVETLFGGDSAEPPLETQRPYSKIESRLAEVTFEQVATALQASFKSIADSPFAFQRIEDRADYGFLGKRGNLAIAARIALKSIGRSGTMLLVIPQAALTPALPNLSRSPSAEAAKPDTDWAKQFETEVGRATVSLQASIDARQLTLGEIASFTLGQVLPLPTLAQNHVRLESNGKPVFWCQLGQADGFYTLRVESSIDEEQEFINDILPEH
jgi:flagellar motor switch protein FliM